MCPFAFSPQDALLPLHQASALVLRVLYVLERLGAAREAVIEGYPAGVPVHCPKPVPDADMRSLRCVLGRLLR